MTNPYLIIGGAGSIIAAVLHVAIIFGGPNWYRFFGAGEKMAQMAEAGKTYPAVITAVIAALLLVWGLYAFSGAGIIGKFPFTTPALTVIGGIFLLRGLAGIPVVFMADHPYLQELAQRMTFMVVSSAICLVLAALYLIGMMKMQS
ncbi:hypothetical protein NF212_15090 [Parasalinivibrio latis]|uniref:hypothetical protein n=1 Tax=Parasalinivibrio latis TaxID=2952610 RepID=UPI0030E394B2